MAKVLFGQGVADMRGSIGGTTFSRSVAGATARNRSKPIAGPPTTSQDAVRNQFAVVQAAYAGLTPADVENWAGFGQSLTFTDNLGNSYSPPPKEAYVHVNRNLQVIGQAVTNIAPSFTTEPDINTGGASITIASVAGPPDTLDTITVAGLIVLDSDAIVVVQATPPISAQKRNYKNLCRQIMADTVANVNGTIETEYKAVFGNGSGIVQVAEGQAIGFRFKSVSKLSGLDSAWFYISSLVPAGS